jgi:hypothetical protein
MEEAAAGTSKSAVSRQFVAMTEIALAELMSCRLDDLAQSLGCSVPWLPDLFQACTYWIDLFHRRHLRG